MNYSNELKKAKKLLKQVDGVLIISGAGMSVESGIPSYRGKNGLWTKTITIKNNEYKYQEISSLKMWEKHPELVWGFKSKFYKNIEYKKPHQGYTQLLNILEKKYKNNYFIVTSNIDCFFEKSGYQKNKIYEVHGSMKFIQCSSKKCTSKTGLVKYQNIKLPEYNSETLVAKNLPICNYCGLYLRPNVSMFGDIKFYEKPYLEQRRKMKKWIDQNVKKNKKIIIIEIGCGINKHSLRVNNGNLMSGEWKIPVIKNFIGVIRINPNDLEKQNNTINLKNGAIKTINDLFYI